MLTAERRPPLMTAMARGPSMGRIRPTRLTRAHVLPLGGPWPTHLARTMLTAPKGDAYRRADWIQSRVGDEKVRSAARGEAAGRATGGGDQSEALAERPRCRNMSQYEVVQRKAAAG
jgi:hypothetical protein